MGGCRNSNGYKNVSYRRKNCGGGQQVLCLVFHLTYFQLLLFSSWCLILKDLKVRKCRVYFSREGLRKEWKGCDVRGNSWAGILGSGTQSHQTCGYFYELSETKIGLHNISQLEVFRIFIYLETNILQTTLKAQNQ